MHIATGGGGMSANASSAVTTLNNSKIKKGKVHKTILTSPIEHGIIHTTGG